MTGKLQLRIIGILIFLIGAFFSFIGLSEFYITGIDKSSNSAYAFGPVNDNQWYYKDAKTYSVYSLVSGLIYLLPSLLLLYYLIKFRRKPVVIFSVIIIVLVMLDYLGL